MTYKTTKFFTNSICNFCKIPHTSGIYYFYDNDKKLLYVGKARNLNSRIGHHHGAYENNERTRIIEYIENSITSQEIRTIVKRALRLLDRRILPYSSQVIDKVFDRVHSIIIEEMPYELISGREFELIMELRPPFNFETAGEEYHSFSNGRDENLARKEHEMELKSFDDYKK